MLNIAIGLQVLLGALVTGLSSSIPPGKVSSSPSSHTLSGSAAPQAGIVTSILGGLSTLVASYLARMRGSREPELSLSRTKDLEHFIRDAKAFELDHGGVTDGTKDSELDEFRRRLEELLGNNTNSAWVVHLSCTVRCECTKLTRRC